MHSYYHRCPNLVQLLNSYTPNDQMNPLPSLQPVINVIGGINYTQLIKLPHPTELVSGTSPSVV